MLSRTDRFLHVNPNYVLVRDTRSDPPRLVVTHGDAERLTDQWTREIRRSLALRFWPLPAICGALPAWLLHEILTNGTPAERIVFPLAAVMAAPPLLYLLALLHEVVVDEALARRCRVAVDGEHCLLPHMSAGIEGALFQHLTDADRRRILAAHADLQGEPLEARNAALRQLAETIAEEHRTRPRGRGRPA